MEKLKEKLLQLLTDPEVAKRRGKAFLWQLGNLILVATLAFAANNLEILSLPPAVIGFLALTLNQLTKQLNSK